MLELMIPYDANIRKHFGFLKMRFKSFIGLIAVNLKIRMFEIRMRTGLIKVGIGESLSFMNFLT